jgi:hypothetical protein
VALSGSPARTLVPCKVSVFRSRVSTSSIFKNILQNEIKRVKNGKALIVPGTENTFGHGTTGQAGFWKQAFAEWFAAVPKR